METDGSFAADAEGDFMDLESALLVSWEDVHFLEVFAPIQED
jgi:hypothetical protein